MREKFDRYIANLEEASRLVKLRVTPGASDREILAQVHNGAERLRQLCLEDNTLLEEMVFLKKPELLTPAEADALYEAADKLFCFSKSVDVGSALCIHRLLYAYAKLHEDRDMMIRELYLQGMTGFYLNLKIARMDINVLKEEVQRAFSQGAAYFDQWDDIASEETRGYIIRCMGNRNLVLPRDCDDHGLAEGRPPEDVYADYLRNFQETMRVVQSPAYRLESPGIPWDAFIYSLHYDRISFLSFLRNKPNRQLAQDVMESAEYVYQHHLSSAREKNKGILDARTVYFYAAARFHNGLISAKEMMDTLLPIYRQADCTDFSLTGIQFNIMYPQYLSMYAKYLSAEEKELYQPQVEQAMRNYRRYLMAIPRNEYINKVASALRDVMSTFGKQEPNEQVDLLDSILACHAPTYIHSAMVAWLNRRIASQLADMNPGALEGVFGFHGVDNIRANREKICDQAYFCGLYHDLGKSMVINYIGIYGRKLLAEEFHCIQYHSEMGSSLLREFPGFENLSEVALFHHRSYDGKGGYPRINRPCASEAREIAYITTVSDCIDAATDNIGRSYAAAKSYDTLIEELFQRSGTAYAPEIVQLFQNREFRETLGSELVGYREGLYCKVYRELAELP